MKLSWGSIGAAVGFAVAAYATGGLSLALAPAALGTTAAVTGVGFMLGNVADQQTAAKAAQKSAEKKAAAAAATQTQYYEDLTENQMKLNLVTGQTQDIVDVINATSQPGPVYTLPSAEPTDPVNRINQAIDDWIKGK